MILVKDYKICLKLLSNFVKETQKNKKETFIYLVTHKKTRKK